MTLTSRAIVLARTPALVPDSYKMNMGTDVFKDHWSWREKRIDAEPLRGVCKRPVAYLGGGKGG